MKASQFSTLTILLFYTIACTNKNRLESTNDHNIKDSLLTINTVVIDTFETGKVIVHISCKADTSQSYALYIPATGNNEALPVIYFFDPHGDGACLLYTSDAADE